jgi:type I restriction enzyme S subunit
LVELLHSIAEQSVSTYPSIKASDIENIEVELPPLVEQKRISSILNSLSDKIRQNTEINKNLAAYSSMFDTSIVPDIS